MAKRIFNKKGNRLIALITACTLLITALAVGLGTTLAAEPDITTDLSKQPNSYLLLQVGETKEQTITGGVYATSSNAAILKLPTSGTYRADGVVTVTGVSAGMATVSIGSTMGLVMGLNYQVYDNKNISSYTLKNGAKVVLSKLEDTAAASSYITTTPALNTLTGGSAVTWKSLHEDIATVAANGTITAVGKGTAIIVGSFTDKWGAKQNASVLVTVGKTGNVIQAPDGSYWVPGDTDNVYYKSQDDEGNVEFPPTIIYDPDGPAVTDADGNANWREIYKGDSGKYYVEDDYPNIWREINTATGVLGTDRIWGGENLEPGGYDDKPAVLGKDGDYYIDHGQNVFQRVERFDDVEGLGAKDGNGNELYQGGGGDREPGNTNDLMPVIKLPNGTFYAGPFYGSGDEVYYIGDRAPSGGNGKIDTSGTVGGHHGTIHGTDQKWYLHSDGTMQPDPEPDPATVTSVTVTPATANVIQGGVQSFTAKVNGTGDPLQSVTWTVSGNSSSGTKVDANGELTIASNETKGAVITVRATSVYDPTKSGTATVTVTKPDGGNDDGKITLAKNWKISTSDSTYIIDDNNHLWSTGLNSYGRLGIGSTYDQRHFVEVRHDLEFARVSQYGLGHVIGLTVDGEVYTWGENGLGALGDDTRRDRTIPNYVNYFNVRKIKIVDVAAGYRFSAALSEDGSVYTWGCNVSGDLGLGHNGSSTSFNLPQRIQVGPVGTKVKQISAGYAHMIVLTENGDLYSWGRNNYGQLGQGHASTINSNYSPKKIMMSTPTKFAYIDTQSYAHALALDENGKLYTWGLGTSGQLGAGANDSRYAPVMVHVSGVTRFQSVAVGWYTSLALAENGDLYTWGRNSDGQLGIGNTANKNVPQKLNTGLKYLAIAAGDQTSMAVADDGNMYIWGNNRYGQYGNGSKTTVRVPTMVPLA